MYPIQKNFFLHRYTKNVINAQILVLLFYHAPHLSRQGRVVKF